MKRYLLALVALLLAPGAVWAGAFDSVAPGGSASSITATGSTTARSAAARAADTFNIMDYGAVCDGTTNDNTAINAAFAAAAASSAYTNNNAVTIVGAATRGCLMNSINATMFSRGTGANLRPRVTVQDMTLLCTGAGNICFDALGADLIKMQNVSIRGNTAPNAPEICIQIGMISATSAAWHSFDHVNCNNEFSFTALYNYGSEAVTYLDSMFHNAHSTTGPIGTLGAITAGSGYTNGTYTAVPLTGGTGAGALARIVVAGAVVTSVTVSYQGRDYAPADTLSVDPTTALGGTGSGFSIPVSTVKPYAAVLDGQNYWRASSAFVTETNAVDTWQSLSLNTFYDSHIRQNASGGGLWLGWTALFRMVNSYVLNSSGSSCVTVFDNGVTKSPITPNFGLNLEMNCEGSALTSMVEFAGSNATPAVSGLKFRGYHLSGTSTFDLASNITAASLLNADVDLTFTSANGVPGAPMFRSAKLWTYSGRVSVPNGFYWNAPATFQGSLVVGGVATPPNLGPLDILGSAAQAWSCARQLRAAYIGPLCQATRASDSATLDIYPNASGDLDRNAYTGFCRATSCTVSVAYDQSGNANNFTQSTGASQPAWVLSTAALGNRPSLTFGDLSAIAMTATHASTIDDMWAAGGYLSAVSLLATVTPNAARILFKTNGGTPGVGWELRHNNGGSSMTFLEGATTTNGTWATASLGVIANTALVTDVQYSSASLANTVTFGVLGSVPAAGAIVQPVGTVSSDAAINLLLGNNAATAGTRGYPGSIAETILWKTTPTAFQLEAIRRNQANYYGVASVN